MILRRSLALLNLGLFAAALVAEIELPQYGTLIFYGLLLWMFLSLALFFGPLRDRPTPRPAAAGAGPLPSSGPPTSIPFCVYCGTAMPPGASFCPACGKAARPI